MEVTNIFKIIFSVYLVGASGLKTQMKVLEVRMDRYQNPDDVFWTFLEDVIWEIRPQRLNQMVNYIQVLWPEIQVVFEAEVDTTWGPRLIQTVMDGKILVKETRPDPVWYEYTRFVHIDSTRSRILE